MNPWAQATIVRAAGSACRRPASSATTRRKVAEERTERAVAPDSACGANMSEYATGFEWANPR